MNKALVGEKFGRLEVIEDLGASAGRHLVRCLCQCGAVKAVALGHLRNGNTKSCGCYRRDMHLPGGIVANINYRHGHSTAGETPTYCSWRAMINRCQNPNDPRYKDYGGRGITVCDSWKKFPAFLADMGERPEGKTLDRAENDLGYDANNCKWSTPTEQIRNRRNSKHVAVV